MRDFKALSLEIKHFYILKDYAGLMLQMEAYEREAQDQEELGILLLAKANAALQQDLLDVAQAALQKIDADSFHRELSNYLVFTKGNLAKAKGDNATADSLLNLILSTEEIRSEDQRELLSMVLTQKAFIYLDENQFSLALPFLELVSDGVHGEGGSGHPPETIANKMGYCLQGLGRLDEAEALLTRALSIPGNTGANTYYRLGAVLLQQGEPLRARASFEAALSNVQEGEISRENILAALREAEFELARFKNYGF